MSLCSAEEETGGGNKSSERQALDLCQDKQEQVMVPPNGVNLKSHYSNCKDCKLRRHFLPVSRWNGHDWARCTS